MRKLTTAILLLATGCASSSGPKPSTAEEPAAPPPQTWGLFENFRHGAIVNIQPGVDRVSVTIGASPQAVLEALVQVYGELDIEITGVDPQAFAVSNQDLLVTRRLGGERPSRYLECGSGSIGGVADRVRIQMSILSQAEATPEGESRLHTTIQAVGNNPEGTSNTRVPCSSTHQLELRIAAEVEKLVGGGGHRAP